MLKAEGQWLWLSWTSDCLSVLLGDRYEERQIDLTCCDPGWRWIYVGSPALHLQKDSTQS